MCIRDPNFLSKLFHPRRFVHVSTNSFHFPTIKSFCRILGVLRSVCQCSKISSRRVELPTLSLHVDKRKQWSYVYLHFKDLDVREHFRAERTIICSKVRLSHNMDYQQLDCGGDRASPVYFVFLTSGKHKEKHLYTILWEHV